MLVNFLQTMFVRGVLVCALNTFIGYYGGEKKKIGTGSKT